MSSPPNDAPTEGTYTCFEASSTGSSHGELCLNHRNFPWMATYMKRSFVPWTFPSWSHWLASASSHNSWLPLAPTGSHRLPTAPNGSSIFGAHTPVALFHEISIYNKYIIVLLVGKSPCQLCLLAVA